MELCKECTERVKQEVVMENALLCDTCRTEVENLVKELVAV